MADLAPAQRAYTAIVSHFLERGRAPHYTELATRLGVSPDVARDLQAAAAEASPACWVDPETHYIASWAPFSNVPTQTRISIDGKQSWFGQGGAEALAVRWLVPGCEVLVDAGCLDCGESVRIRMRDEEILEVDPPTAVIHSNVPLPQWGEHAWSFNGARINLFRSEEHVRGWTSFDPETASHIQPVAAWAELMSGDFVRRRLDDDYLEKVDAYVAEFGAGAARLLLPG